MSTKKEKKEELNDQTTPEYDFSQAFDVDDIFSRKGLENARDIVSHELSLNDETEEAEAALNFDLSEEIEGQVRVARRTILSGDNQPNNLVKAKDPITNAITKGKYVNQGDKPVKVGEKRNRTNNAHEDIYTVVNLSLELSDEGSSDYLLRSKYEIDSFDREVLDAITSIYLSGNPNVNAKPKKPKQFSVGMVGRTMTASSPSTSLSPQLLQRITESIEKLRNTRIYINALDEKTKMYNQVEDLKVSYNAHMLNLTEIDIRLGGSSVAVFEITDLPITFKYASAKKQIVTIPTFVYQVPVQNTYHSILLRSYLSQRIELIRSKYRLYTKNGSKGTFVNTIKLQTLYKDVYKEDVESLNTPNLTEEEYQKMRDSFNHKTYRARRTIDKILKHFKEVGYIKDFHYNKGARGRIISITIEVDVHPQYSQKFLNKEIPTLDD